MPTPSPSPTIARQDRHRPHRGRRLSATAVRGSIRRCSSTTRPTCRPRLAKGDHIPDGDNGILRCGYPIEQLAERSTYLEVAYLLNGELPDAAQLAKWNNDVIHHTFIHENMRAFRRWFHYDAHPMGMLVSAIGRSARSTTTPRDP